MSTEWPQKRWWKSVVVMRSGDGFALQLDSDLLRTPGGREFIVPRRELADLVAAEWSTVEGSLVWPDMHLTRLSNAAMDVVPDRQEEMVESIIGYASSDLICYRAADPPDLVTLQSGSWDHVIGRFRDHWDVEIRVTVGMMPIEQPAETVEAMRAAVCAMDPFELVALCELVSQTGSLLLILAFMLGWIGPEETWKLSRLDHDWQRSKWGSDEDDTARTSFMHLDFHRVIGFLMAHRQPETA